MLDAIWSAITLPFRFLAWVVGLIGRLAAFIVGFVLMVVGVAFWAGGIAIVGLPVFVVGLLLTVRAIG